MAARDLVELACLLEPPVRLPLGTDTLQAIASKNAFVHQETAKWHALSASNGFADSTNTAGA
jgi:hypothetical protein